MNREQKIRNLILDRYTSLRQFAIEADIPYSTLMTLLSRDIGGASFDIVILICKKLDIDPFKIQDLIIQKNEGAYVNRTSHQL